MLKNNNYVVIDVREHLQYDQGHIQNSINIPFDEIKNRISEIPKEKPIIIYCSKGMMSTKASKFLSIRGYEVYNLYEGYDNWVKGDES